MKRDPYEGNNLAGNPAYTDVVKKYQERLQELQRNTSDPWYLNWSYEYGCALLPFDGLNDSPAVSDSFIDYVLDCQAKYILV